jgi:hypothetical protein
MLRYLFPLTCCLAAPVAAQPSSEWLAQGPLPGFSVGFQQAERGSLIVERVPTGETVQRWTRMVTIQRFAGEIAIDAWVSAFTSGLGESCPGARYNQPAWSEIEGRRAVEFRGDCPLNPTTGLPETFMIRAVSGGTALHVAQIAFRRVPGDADVAWARRHLDTVTLCTRDIATPACRAGPGG